MIRSSKHILKFQTKYKNILLDQMFSDFKEDLNFYIDQIISGKLPLMTNLSSKLLEGNIIQHSQWKQIIYKNASEIIRSQIAKANSKRYKIYKKLYAKCIENNKHQNFTNKRFSELKLKPIIQTKYFTKPNLKNISITLDSRVVDFKQDSIHFDEFIRIKTPYFQETKKLAITLKLPIKYHKHSNKFKNWERKNSIRLTSKNNMKFIEFIYEKAEPKLKTDGVNLGIDQGYKKLLSDSNGNHYGKELFHLYQKISNKKQGSKLFKKLLAFRTDEINRIINEFFKQNENLKHLFVEDLKNVKKNSKLFSKTMNKVQRWCYSQVIGKLERYCEENGIQITKVDPAYTSQTCSHCGTVDKESRNGENFLCQHCKYELDADFNAAINIYRLGIMYPSVSKS